MARAILGAGFETTLWARRPETLEPFVGTPARAVASRRELGAASDLVGICVRDDDGVDDVLLGDDGVLAGMQPGGIVAVHSTVSADSCRRWADLAAAHGVAFLDAPVSGGGDVAAEGRLLVMVGGERDAFERALPVLSTYGDPVHYMGPVGSGQLTKLVNNIVFCAHLGTARDAVELADAFGIDGRVLADVLRNGSANSFALGVFAGFGCSAEAMGPAMASLLRKDVDLVTAAAARASADLGVLSDAAERILAVMGRSRGS
jgi:3-hydroxyisobutyrate dehydrogenase-like beta-hydroxyacid dehydrogenase